jgi:hypothetical protein
VPHFSGGYFIKRADNTDDSRNLPDIVEGDRVIRSIPSEG